MTTRDDRGPKSHRPTLLEEVKLPGCEESCFYRTLYVWVIPQKVPPALKEALPLNFSLVTGILVFVTTVGMHTITGAE